MVSLRLVSLHREVSLLLSHLVFLRLQPLDVSANDPYLCHWPPRTNSHGPEDPTFPGRPPSFANGSGKKRFGEVFSCEAWKETV